jgi:4-alpha-glucanotransferase
MMAPTPAAAPPRRAGVFVPVFALRREGDAGCGDTLAVRRMADWCAHHGFRVLQVLPINETSGDNSPYNAISSCALDITTLAPDPAHVPGLTKKTLNQTFSPKLRRLLASGPVRYRLVKALKWQICREAFAHFGTPGGATPDLLKDFDNFRSEEEAWLFPYALFRALMATQNDSPVWEAWPPHLRSLASALDWLRHLTPKQRNLFEVEIRFYQFVQWVLHRQWQETSAHAAAQGVTLMGDIPFGVSRSSADVWAQPEQFDLKWCGGAPPEPLFQPDEFTKKWGQNWGIPLYRWDIMEHDGFAWWRRRVRQITRFFKIFRIDHVLGFYRVYSFPWPPQDNARYTSLTPDEVRALAGDLPRFLPHDDDTEASRASNQAAGERLLRVLQDAAGDAIITAEDLGVVPTYVRPSLLALGISGFKIPMFERDEASREYKPTSEYPVLSLATLSTHDHETMRGMWERLWAAIEADLGPGTIPQGDQGLGEAGRQAAWELYRLHRFAQLDDRTLLRDFEPTVREALLRALWATPSWLAIAMITDLFGLDLRFNVPGPVSESNWSERLPFTVDDLLNPAWRPEVQQGLRPALQAAARLL